MTITLKLEAIGDNVPEMAKIHRPWVAEITGWRGGRWFERDFLGGQKDYSEANSVGSRGVHIYYHLREGRIYEIYDMRSWRDHRRYFCTVSGGQIVQMDAEEVQAAMIERVEVGL